MAAQTREQGRYLGGRPPYGYRLAGHSTARIIRALNDAGIPCPSAADPGRNPHRAGTAWTLRTVAAILANPWYTGRQVWNRQRTDLDPVNTGLGHKQVISLRSGACRASSGLRLAHVPPRPHPLAGRWPAQPPRCDSDAVMTVTMSHRGG
jgi:hypothetical protein